MYSLLALFDSPALTACPTSDGWLTHWQQWLAQHNSAELAAMHWAESDGDSQQAQRWQRTARPPATQARLLLTSKDKSALERLAALLAAQLPERCGLYLCRYYQPLSEQQRIGERTAGTLQLCSFNAKPELTAEQFQQRWLQAHTPVAIATQSTSHYRQHLVHTTLLGDAVDAIVEEQFPATAADSLQHFFNAVGNPEQLRRNMAAMQQSCAQFIDFNTLNVIHLSDWPIAAVN